MRHAGSDRAEHGRQRWHDDAQRPIRLIGFNEEHAPEGIEQEEKCRIQRLSSFSADGRRRTMYATKATSKAACTSSSGCTGKVDGSVVGCFETRFMNDGTLVNYVRSMKLVDARFLLSFCFRSCTLLVHVQ